MSHERTTNWRQHNDDSFQTLPSRSSRRLSRVPLELTTTDRRKSRADSSSNWRIQHPAVGKLQELEGGNGGGHRADSSLTGSKVGSMVSCREKGKVNTLPKSYNIGMIVRVPHITPCLDPNVRFGDKEVSMIDATGPVIGKMRPCVVVGIFPSSLLCLPISTSGGRGCPPGGAGRYMLLRCWYDDGPQWEGMHESKYLVCEPDYESKEGAYVSLNQVFPVAFASPITIIGSLSQVSCERVQAMWLHVMRNGLRSLDTQEDSTQKTIQKMEHRGDYETIRKEYLRRKREKTRT